MSVGSFASGFRGEFRATNDIDIVANFSAVDLDKFIIEVKYKFYADELSIPVKIKNNQSFNLIHDETFTKIDIFTKITNFEDEQFKLATLLKIPSTTESVYVSTVEYNIIAKLNWYIKSNMVLERQLADIKSMLAINKSNLNIDYLRKWTKVFITEDLLRDILSAYDIEL